MVSTRVSQKIASISIGVLAATGVFLGAAIPAAAATPDQSPQDGSTVTAPDGGGHRRPGEAFLRLINEARAHPEQYPPHGNIAGAAMTGCSNPLHYSRALHGTASAHNKYLASQPIEWVRNGNAHKDPNGKFVWDAGQPMDQAGYHSYRAEIVAEGFPTKEDALRAWMQDDEGSGWGHRNIILNCGIQNAGPAWGTYAPSNHPFYTVDMGNR